MKKILVLLKCDAKNISRDSIMILPIIIPVFLTLLVNIALPLLAKFIQNQFSFDISVHYPFVISMILLFTPMFVGMLSGLIILDEKDENMLAYFAVTPLSKTGYLFYRMVTPAITSFLFSFIIIFFTNIISINILAAIPALCIAAMEASVMAVILGTYAGNKLEGLALSKGLGILEIIPIAGYLLKTKWSLILGLSPTYWIPKIFIAGQNGEKEYWLYIIAGLIVHIVFFLIALNIYKKKAV